MSHVVMKKTLAKALMNAGMEDHPGPQPQAQQQQQPQKFGFGGLVGSILNPLIGDTGQSTFQAAPPPIVKQDFLPQISAQQQRQSDVYAQQQNLAQALLQQTQGTGPNPAQAQLAQATGQNVAQQGALMASQRGASANPALLARQAAQQGAGIQQNAAGQAATLQAQQQLAAQQALQQQQQAMAGNALSAEQIQQGGQASQNTAIVGGTNGANEINAGISKSNAQTQGGILGGLISGGGAALASSLAPKKAHGGEITMLDGGGVPGEAQVSGDSEKNDTVEALLSPGEIVLPRSVTQGPDMEKKVIEFLKHIKKSKGHGYSDVADAKKKKLSCGGKV